MIRSFLALSLLFFAAVSHADIVNEHPVSTIVYGPAPGQRYAMAAASDGRDFLVAWREFGRNRSGATQMYAARMNAAGEVLDPLGIRLPNTSSHIEHVNVVFLGNAYLVDWDEPDPNSSATRLMAVRVSREGVLLDTVARVLANPVSLANIHGAASNGNRTVILFRGARLVWMTLVLDRDGNVVAGPTKFTDAGVGSAAIASNGRGFLIAWSAGALYGTLLDDAGAITTSQKTTLVRAPYIYQIASDGDGYLVIAGESTELFAQHFSGAGEVLERPVIPIHFFYSGFVFAAGSYLLMDGDREGPTIGVRRLDRAGNPGGYQPLAAVAGFAGTLASNASDAAAFWTQWNGSVLALNGGVLHANATALTKAEPIARSANAQYTPRAATNGRNIAVVWSESDGVYAGRLTLDGQMLDGRGIRIGDAGGGADIVFDGTNYLIAWADASAVKVTRLFPNFGTVLDPAGITVASSPCVNAMSLSVGSASTLVAWSDCKHILANTVDKTGVVGTTMVVTPPETKETAGVSAAWNGREWLVAWEDRIPIPIPIEGTYTQTFIKAARLSASLTLLDPRPISLTDTMSDVTPFVASDGHDFLVAWTLPIPNPPGAMAQRISADGSMLGTTNGVRIGSGYVTSAVWDGLQYDVAFSSFSYSRPSTLYVTHVAAGGPLEGTAAQAVVSNVVPPDAKLIVTRPGQVIAVYSIVAPDAIYGGADRLFLNAPHAIRERAAGPRSNP
jgi:hypothetical protein